MTLHGTGRAFKKHTQTRIKSKAMKHTKSIQISRLKNSFESFRKERLTHVAHGTKMCTGSSSYAMIVLFHSQNDQHLNVLSKWCQWIVDVVQNMSKYTITTRATPHESLYSGLCAELLLFHIIPFISRRKSAWEFRITLCASVERVFGLVGLFGSLTTLIMMDWHWKSTWKHFNTD